MSSKYIKKNVCDYITARNTVYGILKKESSQEDGEGKGDGDGKERGRWRWKRDREREGDREKMKTGRQEN